MAVTSLSRDGRVRVVVATTVLLSFISFWRAAAIVLADLGSTAFYVGGIVEQAVGPSAPWFILGVMIFSYAVRALYIESSAMFVRGGVYRVVKEAMGGTLAKLSVSALLFDYILTGPISGVSAGSYIAGLINDILTRAGASARIPTAATAAFIAILITGYFWWRNTRGIHESSDDAMTIMKIATAVKVGHTVPFSHPTESSENFMCASVGSGGSEPPRWTSVSVHQAISRTTMTVAIFMIVIASSLLSWMPRVFRHQK